MEWLFPNDAEIKISAQELITNTHFEVSSHIINVILRTEDQERTFLGLVQSQSLQMLPAILSLGFDES